MDKIKDYKKQTSDISGIQDIKNQISGINNGFFQKLFCWNSALGYMATRCNNNVKHTRQLTLLAKCFKDMLELFVKLWHLGSGRTNDLTPEDQRRVNKALETLAEEYFKHKVQYKTSLLK